MHNAMHVVQDLRDAVRALWRQKAYSAAAIVTLSLGIGATTAIFTVINAVVLRPLPFPDAHRLVRVAGTPAERGEAIPLVDVQAFREQATTIQQIAAYAVSARYLRTPSGVQRAMAVMAERGLFDTLGVAAFAGRTLRPDDPVNVVVVSYRFWIDRLGGTPSAIGSALLLDGEPYTVVGVMPPAFEFPYQSATTLQGVTSDWRTDLWVPMYPLGQPLRGRASQIVGRLVESATPVQAQQELALILSRQLAANPVPENQGRGVRLQPLADAVVALSIRRPLFFLVGAVALVLALACANVTNLSLVRMTLRTREVALRSAVGATPRRLVRQFLTESLMLSLVGGAAGLWMAQVGTRQLMRVAGAALPRAREVGFDWQVFLFLLAICTVTGAAFGLVPALVARRADPQALLKEASGTGTMSGAPRRLRDALVVAEVALAFVLAVGGLLLVRELVRLRQVDAGFVSGNVLTFHVGHRMTPKTDPRQFYEIADRVATLPGVRAAGFSQMLPLQNWGWFSVSGDFRVKGRPAPDGPPFQIELRYITPGYFDALGVPVVKGRGLSVRDTREAAPVILINETLARRYFGTADPVGAVTTRGTIAGVVRDVRQVHLDRPANPEIYYPIAQNWSQLSEIGMTLVVKADLAPEALIPAVRATVRDVNADLSVFDIKTLDRVVAESLSAFTVYLWLMASFAVLAVVLALTGTYAVISFVATARLREFAIRMAIGADRARVMRLVIAQGVRLALIGLVIGGVAALAASPLLQNLPVSVRRPDAMTMMPVALVLALVSVIACTIPARRAAKSDPMALLRND